MRVMMGVAPQTTITHIAAATGARAVREART